MRVWDRLAYVAASLRNAERGTADDTPQKPPAMSVGAHEMKAIASIDPPLEAVIDKTSRYCGP